MNEKFIEYLRKIARHRVWGDIREENDGWCVEDGAAGNVDDAYEGGYGTGRTWLAREVLNQLGLEFEVDT